MNISTRGWAFIGCVAYSVTVWGITAYFVR